MLFRSAQDAPPTSSPTSVAQEFRLVVKFASAGQVWNAEALEKVRTSLSTDLRPIAAVSASSWTYRTRLAAGQSMETLMDKLRARPEVVFVELDGKLPLQ